MPALEVNTDLLLCTCVLVGTSTQFSGAQTSIYLASSPDVEGVSGKYFGDCKEEELLPKAMDDLVARKLWDISEVMVGLLK
uniref:Uncharacterized protein n=1 Tax=Otus sunia TaxID=257818 RepID=A0A8C8AJ72_9STRI